MKTLANLLDVILTAGAQTGGGLRSLDLFKQANPANVGIGIFATTNGTAPGAAKDVTIHYALADRPDMSVAQLSDCDSEEVRTLPNAANTERQWTLPVIYGGQRWLYVWFDNVVLDAGATVTLKTKITGSS